jgi:transposase-like protein
MTGVGTVKLKADSEICENLGMQNTNIYAGYRYPPQIISHAVWLYHIFTLSFRDIEELLAARVSWRG